MKYNLLSIKPKLLSFELISLIILVILLIFSLNYKTYHKNYYLLKIVEDHEKYYGVLNIYESDLAELNDNTIIHIDKQKRDFKIKTINEMQGDPLTGLNYQEVIMEIELKEEEKKKNNYLNITFLNNYQTLFKKILNMFI